MERASEVKIGESLPGVVVAAAHAALGGEAARPSYGRDGQLESERNDKDSR